MPRGPRSRPTNSAGERGPRRSTRTFRSEMPSCEACSHFGCSPTRRRAHRSRPRPRRCRKSSAGSATGTTASRGPATRASAIGAFLGAGKDDEARMFLAWLLHASRLDRPRLPVLLTLHGKHPRPERTLDDWPGYANSQPVRVGNGAADQHQLDGYGWVLDAAWLAHPSRSPPLLRDVAGHRRLRRSGRRTLARTRRRHLGDPRRPASTTCTPSSWRGLPSTERCASPTPTDCSTRRRRTLGDRTRRDRRRRSDSTGSTDARQLHAQLRIRRARRRRSRPSLPRHRTARLATRSRARSTRSRATSTPVGRLLYRYPPGRDGLPGTEGAFMPCAFWLVQALAKTGRIAEATDVSMRSFTSRHHSASTPRRWNPPSRDHLGNYPQALTHAALVQAALALRDNARYSPDE